LSSRKSVVQSGQDVRAPVDGKPWKLLLLRTGNLGTRDLKELFRQHLAEIVQALEQNSLVELDRLRVQGVA
jgi:predicted nuclease of predicted toxin-antitoxin system